MAPFAFWSPFAFWFGRFCRLPEAPPRHVGMRNHRLASTLWPISPAATLALRQPPLLGKVRDESSQRSFIGPTQHLPSLCIGRAKIGRRWRNPDTGQVQPIRIPTRLDSNITFDESVRVIGTSSIKQLEVLVAQLEQRAMPRCGQFRATKAMSRIIVLVHAPRVMKQGEQSHDVSLGLRHLGKPQAVL